MQFVISKVKILLRSSTFMFTCSWQFHHCNILFLWQQIVASDLQRVQYQYIIQKCILLVTWIQSNDLSSKYFPHSSQVPQQQCMSFFRLNFLPLNQHTFWHFFMVILHYGLRPRRNLIFWTLHRFTNINCKICFSVLSNPESNLLHIYDPRILHGQHILVL